jgi:hypothetical protein
MSLPTQRRLEQSMSKPLKFSSEPTKNTNQLMLFRGTTGVQWVKRILILMLKRAVRIVTAMFQRVMRVTLQ